MACIYAPITLVPYSYVTLGSLLPTSTSGVDPSANPNKRTVEGKQEIIGYKRPSAAEHLQPFFVRSYLH